MSRENPVFTHQEASSFYDAFGVKQDSQGWYEDAAIDELVSHAAFETARSVLELGCGTGRVAERLLEELLPEGARYVGLDVSETMVGLAAKRLSRFGKRVTIRQTDGSMSLDLDHASFDRGLATYLLDLLSDTDIRLLLAEAHRALVPGGCLCLASLTVGERGVSRFISRIWSGVQRLRPEWVGGCRPVEAVPFLDNSMWNLRQRNKLTAWGMASEVVVAEKI